MGIALGQCRPIWFNKIAKVGCLIKFLLQSHCNIEGSCPPIRMSFVNEKFRVINNKIECDKLPIRIVLFIS